LFAVGCENDPDFPGADPTVYTNLWLQIKSKLLAGETGSERPAVLYFRTSSRAIAGSRTTSASPRLRPSRWRACLFASRLQDV